MIVSNLMPYFNLQNTYRHIAVKLIAVSDFVSILSAVVILVSATVFSISFPALSQSDANSNQLTPILVRQGQHPDYSRIVIDLPQETQAKVEKIGGIMRITLSAGYLLNFSDLQEKPLLYIGNPRQTTIGNTTYAEFDVPEQSNLVESRPQSLLIVNIIPETDTQPISKREPPEVDLNNTSFQNPSSNFESQPTAPLDVEKSNGAEVESDIVNALDGATSGEIRSNLQSPDEEDAFAAGEQNNPDPNADKWGPGRRSPLQISGLSEVDLSKSDVSIDVTAVENGLELRFNWDIDVAAAAFERGRFLWLVFDQPYRLDLDGLLRAEQLATRRISGIELTDHPDALILRLAVRPNQHYTVEKEDKNWIITFKDTLVEPRFPLRPIRRNIAGIGQQVFVPANDLGRKIELEDPIVGDILTIFPLKDESRGLANGYSYSVAELPATSQGILVISLTDDIQVERLLEGVSVSSLSGTLFAEDNIDSVLLSGDLVSKRLIDFVNWRGGPTAEYRVKNKELLYRLSVADADTINAQRWDLARFNLGHGRASEALGYLELIERDQPSFADEPLFLAVRGVTLYLLKRYKEAMADLAHDLLSNEQDADLWRTAIAYERGRYRDALTYYRRGKDVIGTYDMKDRVSIQLAAIKSALELEEYEQASREIDLTENLEIAGSLREEFLYQKARLYTMTGRENDALDLLDTLALSSDYGISARAKFTRLVQALEDGTIEVQEAIDQFERLRYSWRGNDLEIRIIDQLAALYQEVGRYRDSLTIMKMGLSFLPDQAPRYKFSTRQRNLFKALFLQNKADELRPLQAITLWYEFRELTPLGVEGDRMIRNLANRLVDVEAFDEAAELLTYQVTERLEGAARAQVAFRLAAILITSGKPENALQILRATREPRLPEDIQNNRRWIEARALLEMDKYEEAAVLLEQDKSETAEKLLSDIYWASKDWPNLVAVNKRLLGDGWRQNEVLDAIDRVELIRLALAMTFERDREGLIEIRQRYGDQMKTGSFAIAFEGLTTDQQLTTKELGDIASSIANVEKYRDFIRDYDGDFGNSNSSVTDIS